MHAYMFVNENMVLLIGSETVLLSCPWQSGQRAQCGQPLCCRAGRAASILGQYAP